MFSAEPLGVVPVRPYSERKDWRVLQEGVIKQILNRIVDQVLITRGGHLYLCPESD